MKIRWIGCAPRNFREGRAEHAVEAIVLHLIDGTQVLRLDHVPRECAPAPRSEPLRRIELDMDYYRDDLSHGLHEVVPNVLSLGKRKTDPRRIYALRWMAGKMAGEDFAPLYTLE